MRGTETERFFCKVIVTKTCWIWNAAVIVGSGYGQFRRGKAAGLRRVVAHRFAYETLVGPVPDGTELDHLCSNRRCVNPEHLEAVDHRTNILRGAGQMAKLHRFAICRRGHSAALRYPSGHCRVCERQGRQVRARKAQTQEAPGG